MEKRPELEVRDGTLAGRRFAVGAGGLRLGRSSSNDIQIPDEELSRNHCLFEAVGETGIRVTDLASANGTFVNGRPLGGDPVVLHVGDRIEVGATHLAVVGESGATSAGGVDLGLGQGEAGDSGGARRRSPVANVLWVVACLAIAAAIACVLLMPPAEVPPVQAPAADDEPTVMEASYEKVEADANGIFRYAMSFAPDGVLSVVVDDVPKENRHVVKRAPLDERARAELGDILSYKALKEIDREYAGPEPDPPALASWTLRVVYSTRVRSVRIVNTAEPPAFRLVRERLEAFSKNQLGIWAIQYSRDKLVALAEEKIALGRSKWSEREVQNGNLFEAVSAYREALFYLETVDPKPSCAEAARSGLKESQDELDRRYRDQRFLADRAINLGQWDVARRELATLVEMVPDRADARNREAAAKLVDVEKRMKGGK